MPTIQASFSFFFAKLLNRALCRDMSLEGFKVSACEFVAMQKTLSKMRTSSTREYVSTGTRSAPFGRDLKSCLLLNVVMYSSWNGCSLGEQWYIWLLVR
ncbi:hypothetical protein BDV24DRAFT_143725 [Aspergillus arachidicola]|uniref:Uncharacterized protein n=1 Tax=Aspergillus arachidicola TaxID=656916 RepID=A0A5N6XQR7_9EURO|nr:hypothetical protein BDV24DRAFT_143725 [Aspergillus arachidicola]